MSVTARKEAEVPAVPDRSNLARAPLAVCCTGMEEAPDCAPAEAGALCLVIICLGLSSNDQGFQTNMV